jgi:hypothetical protein
MSCPLSLYRTPRSYVLGNFHSDWATREHTCQLCGVVVFQGKSGVDNLIGHFESVRLVVLSHSDTVSKVIRHQFYK